ncbi:RHS repeat-associated core domain-containing protein, partial [Nostoc sp. NIES-2111]
GKITQQKNWVSGEEVTYLYDELERLSSAATTSTAWGLAWSYDGFGNRLSQNLTKGTGPTNSTLVDANTNRISSFGYAYDANGNLTNMPQQNAQLSYDSSNRMTRFSDLNDAESYQYAPDNKRIWRSKGCTYYNQATGIQEPRPQIIFYSVFGQKLGEYCLTDNVTAVQEYVYFGGRMVAKTNIGSGPTLYSFKTDRLHSNQDAPGGGFFPYGETKSGAATTGESFATYSRDWHGLDYADQRSFLPGAGRFLTSDPYIATSSGANEPSQPRTWNRYSYSANDPVNYVDPKGLSFYGPSLEQEIDVWGLPWWMPFMPPPELDPAESSSNGFGPNPEWQTPSQVKFKVDAWDVLIASVLAINESKDPGDHTFRYPRYLQVEEDCYVKGGMGGAAYRKRTYSVRDQFGGVLNGNVITQEYIYIQSGSLDVINTPF